jgi:quinohemoprotein ethanol dehydrogenase
MRLLPDSKTSKLVVLSAFAMLFATYSSAQINPVSISAAPVDSDRLLRAEESNDWLTYGRTYSEQRYSPLAQIDRNTVEKLGLAWWVQFDTSRGQEATPLVADGVIYTTTAWSKVYAFDARTGRQLWSFDPKVSGKSALVACCDVVNRGIALWQDRVFVGTVDGRLIALDRKTGKQIWSMQTTDPKLPYTITGAPRAVKGKVVIGNGGSEYGVRGYFSAYDADTGTLAWRFYVTPNPEGKPDGAASDEIFAREANATWFGDVWKTSGGGGTPWDAITYDPETDLLLIGTGNGAPWNHFIRSEGKGDNLFLSSIVAVRPETGQYVWHYQTTPGDTWDYTATQPIMTADLVINGAKRHVVMQAPKNGFFYVLDARTGELLSADKWVPWIDWAHGVDLRTSRPIERIGTRWGAGGASRQNPGPSGAHSWKSMAFNPGERLVYIPTLNVTGNFVAPPNPDDYRQIVGTWNRGVGIQGVAPAGLAVPGALERAKAAAVGPRPMSSSSGELVAWDPVARKARWRIMYSGPDWGMGGVLTTAGNLVFQSVKHDLKAYDAASGKEIWRYPLQASAIAAPITYSLDGVQYLALMVGSGGGNGQGGSNRSDIPVPGRLLVFKLGGKALAPTHNPIVRPLVDVSKAQPSTADAVAGDVFYNQYCRYCHGGNFIYPDLSRSRAILSQSSFKAIVHDGMLENRGMVGFSSFLTEQDVEAVRAFLLKRASPGAERR